MKTKSLKMRSMYLIPILIDITRYLLENLESKQCCINILHLSLYHVPLISFIRYIHICFDWPLISGHLQTYIRNTKVSIKNTKVMHR